MKNNFFFKFLIKKEEICLLFLKITVYFPDMGTYIIEEYPENTAGYSGKIKEESLWAEHRRSHFFLNS